MSRFSTTKMNHCGCTSCYPRDNEGYLPICDCDCCDCCGLKKYARHSHIKHLVGEICCGCRKYTGCYKFLCYSCFREKKSRQGTIPKWLAYKEYIKLGKSRY